MLGLELRKSQQTAERTFESMVSKTLLPGHLTIMVLIKNNPNQSQSSVANAAGLDRSSLVPVIQQFEKHGWIIRQKSSVDARANIMNITQKGLNHIDKYLPLTQALEKKIKKQMSAKDYQTLLALLKKFRHCVSEIIAQE